MPTKRMLLLAALVLTPSISVGGSAGGAGKEIKIGDPIGNLTFKDIHYLPRSLNDF